MLTARFFTALGAEPITFTCAVDALPRPWEFWAWTSKVHTPGARVTDVAALEALGSVN